MDIGLAETSRDLIDNHQSDGMIIIINMMTG